MTTDSIGIPYAPWVERNGIFIDAVRCPECGEEIAEQTDKYGEQTSANYQDHYAEKHAA